MCAQYREPFDGDILEQVARELRRVPAQGAPTAVFDALRRCTPVAGGLIGSMREGADAIVSHVVRLPANVLEGWASAPREDMTLMLAPLLLAPAGRLISDTQAIRGPSRDKIELLHLLRASGLGEAAGYKVGTSSTERGEVHRFLTFALEEGQTFTERERVMLAALEPEINASLDRLRLPLIASQSLLAQIVEERVLGFLCITRDGRCVELNQRAYELVTAYRTAAHLEGDRSALSGFAMRALAKTRPTGSWQIQHESGERGVEVSTHWLAKETHALSEDLWLVMMRESILPKCTDRLENAGLTRRQREIARLLVETGLSYKELAGKMRIREGTMRKHVENIYRRMKVQSRAELVALLR